jgi:hypothetical protein
MFPEFIHRIAARIIWVFPLPSSLLSLSGHDPVSGDVINPGTPGGIGPMKIGVF